MEATVISAFTEEQAARLTGLTRRQLRHWDRTGFFLPSLAAEDRHVPSTRVYTFQDLLSLQVLKALRIDLGCSLQHLREVKAKLEHLGDDRWSRTTLYVLKKKVVFHDDATGDLHEPVSGQRVLQIPLKVVRANMRSAVEKLSTRDADDYGRIVRKRTVSRNADVIAGTRISVAAIRRLAEDGLDTAQILVQYPSLTAADVQAALQRASEKTAA